MIVGTYTAAPRTNWYLGLKHAATGTTYPTVGVTATEPASVDEASPTTANAFVASCGQGSVQLMFAGTGADNTDYHARVYLWRLLQKSPRTDATAVWIPTFVGEVVVTLSAVVGVAGGILGASDRIADTIADTGSTFLDSFIAVESPGNDRPAVVNLTTVGFQKVGVYFDLDAGQSAASSANVIYTTNSAA